MPLLPSCATRGYARRQARDVDTKVTALAATPSVVPTIDAKDDLSGKWYNLLTGVAITATGTTVLKVGRGLAAVANAAAADGLPGTLRLVMTHGDADSITYSAAAHLLG